MFLFLSSLRKPLHDGHVGSEPVCHGVTGGGVSPWCLCFIVPTTLVKPCSRVFRVLGVPVWIIPVVACSCHEGFKARQLEGFLERSLGCLLVGFLRILGVPLVELTGELLRVFPW